MEFDVILKACDRCLSMQGYVFAETKGYYMHHDAGVAIRCVVLYRNTVSKAIYLNACDILDYTGVEKSIGEEPWYLVVRG